MKQRNLIVEFKHWWNNNDYANNFHFICISYNPRKKENIKIDKFDLSFNISNKRKLAKIIYISASKHIGKKYKAQLFDPESLWLDKKLKINPELHRIRKYLENSANQKLHGVNTFRNLFLFLDLFLKYPSEHISQPLIINSLDKEVIIFITDHETVFIVSKDEKLVNKIGKEIDMNGANVLFSKDLLKGI